MHAQSSFQGFGQGSVDFLAQLARHNQRAWFQERKELFERELLAPARALVEDLGRRLQDLAPGLHADPRVNRSLFRLQRDTRFSADKSPYKTHLGLWLWEGNGGRMECSGYYFHLEPPNLMLAAGIYLFPRHLLGAYRQDAVDQRRGPALAQAVAEVRGRGYEVGGLHYQRPPRGVDPGHPNAELLRHNGLYGFQEMPIPPELHSSELVDFCFQRYLDLTPLHQWLVEMTLRAPAPMQKPRKPGGGRGGR